MEISLPCQIDNKIIEEKISEDHVGLEKLIKKYQSSDRK
jgi:hypothetical protein